jgi:hypothetical protein
MLLPQTAEASRPGFCEAQLSGLIEEDIDGELAADPILLREIIITQTRGDLEFLQVSCDADAD